MMSITITKLYELLSTKLGKETAENLTTFIEKKINDDMEDKLKVYATKADLLEAKNDLLKWIFIIGIGQLVAILLK